MTAPRLSLIAFIALAAVTQAQDRKGPPANLKSVEAGSDHTVTFRLYAPKATEVSVSGDFGAGKMTKDDDGVWSLKTAPLTPDFYSYLFSVDGVRMVDPNNPLFKPGLTGLNSMFEVPGDEAAFEATQNVPHGEVRLAWFPSPALGGTRRMHVYTPPGYEGSSDKYPVLYLLHGSGDDDSGWSTIGRTGFILDNLIAAGKAKPMLVVMPNGSLPIPPGIKRFEADGKTTTAVWRDAADANQVKISKHFVEDVVGFVEKTYRVKPGATNRALAGLSMGGGQTTRVLTTTPEAFTYYGIWSAGVGREGAWEEKNAAFLSRADKLNSSIKLLSICVGDQDKGALEGSKLLDETLTRRGIKHELHISGGGHTWINWRHYLNETAPRLFQ